MSLPLTPAECDLRDFPRMMLDITRLRASKFDTIRDDAAWRAGLNLWMSSWHQVPAGSLPTDDDELTKAAGLGRDVRSWRKVKALALRGWELADDGLLYHEVVAEIVLEAWLDKLGSRLSSDAGNAKRYGHEFDPAPLYADIRSAAAMLERLNRKSKALRKQHVMKSRKASADAPDGLPLGASVGVQPGSQGNRTDQNGVERKKDKPSSSAPDGAKGKASRRKPAVAIPADFPTSEAIAEQQAKARTAGANIDAAYEAERFRNWAQGKDQRFADWAAAWRNWMAKAIKDAPKASGAGPQIELVWDGPTEVREAVRASLERPEYADSYLKFCAATPAEKVVSTENGFVADLLRKQCGGALSRIGWRVLVKGRAA